MKKKKQIIKYSIIGVIAIIIIVLGVIIYKNIFASKESTRFNGVEDHVLTKEEKNNIKDTFSDIDKIEKIDSEVNSKIIRIHILLSEDVDFNKMKDLSNKAIEKINEDNLKFYDVEIFIESKNEESSTYPQIGYKHKSNSKFSW